MKRIIILFVLFAAIGTMDSQAQYRQEPTVWGSNDGQIQSDERGEYRWEMRERRVWIPEYRTRGILGVGARTIPGHYEMRNERVKVYLKGERDNNKKDHPHGMPPGQRKKLDKYGDNRGNEDRNDRYERNDRDRRYEDGSDKNDDERYERNDRDRRYEDGSDKKDDDRYERKDSNKKNKGKNKGDRD